jgi:hypothetical protein
MRECTAAPLNAMTEQINASASSHATRKWLRGLGRAGQAAPYLSEPRRAVVFPPVRSQRFVRHTRIERARRLKEFGQARSRHCYSP